ncbi:MarR family transcriptional regulator [Chitinimonas viridis]|uniref:MarR family transcriptional regulator n=1 Tax=Chitinimonas viridis TaxID=664880 RepID=A0ABT8B6X0_9NEIS|nr:MarR family transcriptional regulator [Chitinimonas viridis]MDN3577896.1 MarR family transcriptional regulator [Chitinimonas viridis]
MKIPPPDPAYGRLDELASAFANYAAMLDAALADAIGLSVTDHKALGLIVQQPGMTQRQLADQTQLTSGAITGLIDRLEHAGFVQRQPHPQDRRSVVLMPVADRIGAINHLYQPLSSAIQALDASYPAAQQRLIHQALGSLCDLLQQHTQRLRQDPQVRPSLR